MPENNCPFYGHHLYPASSKLVEPPFLLIAQGGNQCALIVTAYAPCKLEIERRGVDWRECPVAAALEITR